MWLLSAAGETSGPLSERRLDDADAELLNDLALIKLPADGAGTTSTVSLNSTAPWRSDLEREPLTANKLDARRVG